MEKLLIFYIYKEEMIFTIGIWVFSFMIVIQYYIFRLWAFKNEKQICQSAYDVFFERNIFSYVK